MQRNGQVGAPLARKIGQIRVGQKQSADLMGIGVPHCWVVLRGGTIIYDGVMGRFYDAAEYRARLRSTVTTRTS